MSSLLRMTFCLKETGYSSPNQCRPKHWKKFIMVTKEATNASSGQKPVFSVLNSDNRQDSAAIRHLSRTPEVPNLQSP